MLSARGWIVRKLLSSLTSTTLATAWDCDATSPPSPRWMPDLSCVARAIAERCRRYPTSGIVFAICARPSLGGCRCTLCTLLCQSSSTATWRLKRRHNYRSTINSRTRARAKLSLRPALSCGNVYDNARPANRWTFMPLDDINVLSVTFQES